ncbi:MAG: hypothetical protein Q4P29_01540 [Tissierellia bacterium]|nr:hypothetical protein [Tissierellia bacterium]
MINYFNKDICAILPTYIDGYGMATSVYFSNGTKTIDKKSINSVLKIICRCGAVDRKAQIAKFIKFNKYILPPLVVGNRVFVMFKSIKPKAKGDSAYGFFDYNHISWIARDELGYAQIVFKNGNRLRIYCKFETAAKHFMFYQEFYEDYLNK